MSVTGTPLRVLPHYCGDRAAGRRPSASVHPGHGTARRGGRALTADRPKASVPGLGPDIVVPARHTRVDRHRAAPDHRLFRLEAAVPLSFPRALRGLVNGQRSPGWVAIFGPLGALAAGPGRTPEPSHVDKAACAGPFVVGGAQSTQAVPPTHPSRHR
ncbi:hypothetical protein ACWC0C_04645 [Streptomyces sp. NPDC001709]